MAYEAKLHDGFRVSDDPARLDVDTVHRFISEQSYWAAGRTRQQMERAIAHSICFGLLSPDGSQAGFARVVSDRVTRAHINDVFVLPVFRGRGLGEALIAAVLAHPELQDVKVWSLSTRDAHALYARFGFGQVDAPENQMMRSGSTSEKLPAVK